MLIGNTGAVLLILLACAVVGQRLLRLFARLPLTGEEEFFYGLGLGLGALSYLVYLIGLMGWLKGGVPVLMMGVAGCAGFSLSFRRGRQDVYEMLGAILHMPMAFARRLPSFYRYSPVIILLLAFLGSGVPIHLTDDLHFYSLLPKHFMEEGRIVGWVEGSYGALNMVPLGGLSLFTLLYGLGGDGFVIAFQFLIGLLAVVGTAVLFRRMVGAEAAVLGAVIFVTTPIVVLMLSATRVDFLVAVMATVSLHALYCGIERREKNTRAFLILAAIFLGFSVGVKLTAVPLVIVVYGSVILFSLAGRLVLRSREVIIMVVLSLALAVPWLARAWWYTGNPVWPFLNETLGHLGLSVLAAHGTSIESYGTPSALASPARVLRLAWQFVHDFSAPPSSGAHVMFASFFPLIVFSVFSWSAGLAIRVLTVVSALYFWLLFSIAPEGQFRYAMAGLPAISCVTGFSVVALKSRFSWIKPVTHTIVGFSCVLAVLLAVRTNLYRLPYIAGIEKQEQFVARMNLTYSGAYPFSMLMMEEIVKESGLSPFSSRLRYDTEPTPDFKAYYGEGYFRQLREEAWAAAKRGDVSFIVTVDPSGHIRLRTPGPSGP